MQSLFVVKRENARHGQSDHRSEDDAVLREQLSNVDCATRQESEPPSCRGRLVLKY